jgi:hypothetical protein
VAQIQSAYTGLSTFSINAYGADPTGTALSDSAFTKAYAGATAAIVPSVSGGPTAGALVVLGTGVYKFSPNVVQITDPRIGLIGPGNQVCTLYTTGSSGDLVYVTDSSPGRAGVSAAAPVGGFMCFGWSAGAGVNGFHYGDRVNGHVQDITCTGFIGAGSRGYLFRNDNGSVMEGSYIVVDAQQCTVLYDFDGNGAGGSFDYSTYILHCVGKASTANITVLRVINQGHLVGGDLALRGNISSTSASFTASAVQVGASGSDTAKISSTQLDVSLECDNSAGTVTDLTVTGASASAGILTCSGIFRFLNAAGSFTAGSVGGSAVVTGWGYWTGPLFSSHGTQTALGTAAAGLSTYSG